MISAILVAALSSALIESEGTYDWKKGDVFKFQSTSVGDFTSYGGVVTPVKHSQDSFLKIVTDVSDTQPPTFKAARWLSEIVGEPKYVVDVVVNGQLYNLSQVQSSVNFAPYGVPRGVDDLILPDAWFFQEITASDVKDASNRGISVNHGLVNYKLIELGSKKIEGSECTKYEVIGIKSDYRGMPMPGHFSSAPALAVWVDNKDGLIRQMTIKVKREATLDKVAGTLDTTLTATRVPHKS